MRVLVLALLAACASAALATPMVEHQLEVDPSEVPEHLRHLLSSTKDTFPVIRDGKLNQQSQRFRRYVSGGVASVLKAKRPCSADCRVVRVSGGALGGAVGAGSSGSGSWCSSQRSQHQRERRLWTT